MCMDGEQLKSLIIDSLEQQGFHVEDSRISPPSNMAKGEVRKLHDVAKRYRIEKSKKGLVRHERRLLEQVAAGQEVIPEKIMPHLVEIKANSEEELLFRYATLHWSIPVSSGYGRRLRFLVIDNSNNKLMGIIGLGDPVISLEARDRWIGWNRDARHNRLRYVLDAFVLGAIPPYSNLLCGKLMALLAVSSDVRNTFFDKYKKQNSLIRNRIHDIPPVLVTTMSALGRSSIYNRLKYPGGVSYQSVGYTAGYGEFHFSNGLYKEISDYAHSYCTPTSRKEQWGKGFRNRREIIRKVLLHIGISDEWLCHGLKREIFVVPLASNAQKFLCGEDNEPQWFDLSAAELFTWFRERWLIPRAKRDCRYLEFNPSSYRLWEGNNPSICHNSPGEVAPPLVRVVMGEGEYARRGVI
jgi:hypothetical protein